MAVGLKKGERKKRQSYEEIVGASDFSDSDLLNYEEAAVISSDDDFVCIFFLWGERYSSTTDVFCILWKHDIDKKERKKSRNNISMEKIYIIYLKNEVF